MLSVKWRLYFHIVIKVAEHIPRMMPRRRVSRDEVRIVWLGSLAPGLDARRPAGQGLLGISTRIKLLVAMQAKVHEIRGNVLPVRPFPRGVCDDQSDIMFAQQLWE